MFPDKRRRRQGCKGEFCWREANWPSENGETERWCCQLAEPSVEAGLARIMMWSERWPSRRSPDIVGEVKEPLLCRTSLAGRAFLDCPLSTVDSGATTDSISWGLARARVHGSALVLWTAIFVLVHRVQARSALAVLVSASPEFVEVQGRVRGDIRREVVPGEGAPRFRARGNSQRSRLLLLVGEGVIFVLELADSGMRRLSEGLVHRSAAPVLVVMMSRSIGEGSGQQAWGRG